MAGNGEPGGTTLVATGITFLPIVLPGMTSSAAFPRAELEIAEGQAHAYLAGDLDPHTQEDAYTLYNARVAVGSESGHWELALVGRNLTDEEVRIFSNDPFLLDGLFFSYLAPPRTLEVQFNLRY